MKEFTKSFFSYSLATAFFGLKQIDNILSATPARGEKPPAVKSFDTLTKATTRQFGETLADTFQAADNVQRGMVEMAFNVFFPFAGSFISRTRREESSVAEPGRWTDVVEPLSETHYSETVFNSGRRT
jgi:hypothetical protein